MTTTEGTPEVWPPATQREDGPTTAPLPATVAGHGAGSVQQEDGFGALDSTDSTAQGAGPIPQEQVGTSVPDPTGPADQGAVMTPQEQVGAPTPDPTGPADQDAVMTPREQVGASMPDPTGPADQGAMPPQAQVGVSTPGPTGAATQGAVTSPQESSQSSPRVDGPGQPTAADQGSDQGSAQLLASDELDSLNARWQQIQVTFVDEPQRAIQEADALVAELMEQLTRVFALQRDGLEAQWSSGQDVSTEDLRLGLQRYRSLFQRLLAA